MTTRLPSALFLTLSSIALSTTTFAAPPRVAVVTDSDSLIPALTQGGAKVVGLEDLKDADVLVLQSSDTKPLPKVDPAAIAAFTQRGGGLVIIGGGITAGEWLKPLAGGTWAPASRKFSSLMMLYPLTDVHPITKDASPFDLKDDTAYDLDLDPAVTVLASAFTPKITAKRVDARAPEKLDRANVYDLQPQMWTYEAADKHRAFVLLQDQPDSLKHPSIRSFILRGIAWAAKHEQVDELCTKADLATLRYPDGGPRPAAETVKAFDLHPGFTARAIASEPFINKPIAMQWDGQGRLWIAETPEYPNGRRPLTEPAWKETGVLKPDNYDRPATDRISIVEDTNGDGVFDKKTVFYTGLELVTGFCLWRDGVIAVGQPDIVFIHGEGAAQKVERLYTGFTPGDTHFVANHFIVSPDGWIYADTGSGPDVKSVLHPEVTAHLSSGCFRFKPDGSAIEQVGSKGGNGFGLDITSDGEILFGQATSANPLQHVVLPEWVLAKGKVGRAGSAESLMVGRKVVRSDMPSRVPYMQIDVVGGYSSATASTVQEGGAWPADWNDTIFCTEPILDIIHFEKMKSGGPNITGDMTEPNREWLRSHDFWFFPVDLEFGPDGAMYVLDFYNPIVAHSDSRGPKHSRAGASVRPDREHYFGRIYRIQSDDAKKLEIPDLTKADPAALVKAFTHPSKVVRSNAHRLLLDRPDAATAVPALTAMATNESFPPARILALWALERLGHLDAATLNAALTSPEVGVRKSALLMVEALGAKNPVNVSALLNDADARVRLLALRAMSATPLNPEGAAALLAVLPKLTDDWSRSAAVAAASSNAGPMLEAALASTTPPGPSELDLAASLATSLTDKQDSAALARVLLAAARAPREATPLVAIVLNRASAKPVPAPADLTGVPEALKTLLHAPSIELPAGVLPFIVSWNPSDALKAESTRILHAFLSLAGHAQESDASRAAAITALARCRAADPALLPGVLSLVKQPMSDGLLLDTIAALISTGDPTLGQPLVAVLPNLSPLGQTALFDALVTRSEWANAILDAMAAKTLPPALLGPAKLSKLRLHPDGAVSKRAAQVFAEVGAGSNPAKDEIIAKLQKDIESKAGDAAKGKVLFTSTCATCHKIGGEGQEVGPVLDGIGVHGTHELLVHIIDPSRVVDNEHRTWNLALKNGQFATGIISRENDRTVTLKLPGGVAQDVKVSDIKSRQDTGLSLMPEGFEGLGADNLRDILAFLGGGSKYRAVNLGASFTTDTGHGLYASREALNDTVQPVKYGVVTVEGVPFALPDPTTTPTGGNVIVLKNADGPNFAGTLPQRVEIPVGFPVGNLHFLGGVAGWGGGPESHRPAMKVTIEHADGQKQVEELYTGDVFIDYVSGEDVPGSKRVEGLTKRAHVRYFALPIVDRSPVTKLVLESYNNGIAPTTLAITTDNEPPQPRRKTTPAN